jgi:hypothetical protein
MPRQSSKTTTNHQEIRRWAEARGAHPAAVKGTGGGGDPGMIRLDFPGYSGGDSLEEISWDAWFKAFDDNNLALVYQDQTAKGARSNFNKLVERGSSKRASGRKSSTTRARNSASGRKSTSKRSRSTSAAKSTSKRARSSAAKSTRRKTTSAKRSHATRASRSARAHR